VPAGRRPPAKPVVGGILRELIDRATGEHDRSEPDPVLSLSRVGTMSKGWSFELPERDQ
jgi:hypothetical protein